MAAASGAAVGNLYYAQPLLDVIARDLRIAQSSAGLLVTAAQIGYAVGILAIVPLGDIRNRRRLTPLMMALSAVALAACAVAPNAQVLLCAMVAVGLTTVSAQILIPLAGDLADDGSRGRVVGVVLSGALTGILTARVLSGLVAGVLGWRTVFALAALVMLALAVALAVLIPSDPPRRDQQRQRYGALLRSIPRLVRTERGLWPVLVYGATTFAAFTIFWTGLTFLLSGPPYHYSTWVIGLFSLAGLVGAVAAQGTGRLHDRGWSDRATGLSWLLGILSWLVCLVAGLSGDRFVPLLVLGIVLLDVATQSQRILNQANAFELVPTARSRINTAYITGNFVGGALGSVAASLLWAHGGWLAVSLIGATLSTLALLFWLTPFGRRRTAAH